MGWENIFHCEWNPFGQQVLRHHFLNSISYNDITKTDFTIHRGSIDILTGGFPCQPYSLAGKQKGKEDERYLWPEMLRAIREIQPRFVVGENVFGLINWNGGMVFNEVQTDLEAEGYEVWPYVLPACAVNAPHRRDRVWFVAYNDNIRQDGCKCEHEINSSKRRFNALNDIEQINVRNTNSTIKQRECIKQQREGQSNRPNSKIYRWEDWGSSLSKSDVYRKYDGVSRKLDESRLAALGNAIVPQVAYQIFKAIQEINQQNG
jgi:DNA (cytosine-5)-methyltransferase 1